MFLLNMLIVGLVETSPDVFLLQLLPETGEIVEYTISKNNLLFNASINSTVALYSNTGS